MRKKFLLTVVTLGLVLGGAVLPPGTSLAQKPSPADVGATLPSDWWDQAQAYIRQSEYFVTWQEEAVPDAPAGYQAPNRAQDLRTAFYPDGLRIVRRTDRQPPWVWGLGLTGFDAPTLTVHENRVIYRRGPLTEEYVNTTQGLEQTLSVARSGDGGPLAFEFALNGDLTAHRQGRGFEFRHDGKAVLHYGNVQATDAAGRALPVQVDIVPRETGGVLRLIVDGAKAIYPLHIQASITGLSTGPDWSIQGNQQDAQLGYSVATAGDVNGDGYSDVIVGAPGYDSGQAGEGKVWVYHGSPTGLSSTAAWSAEVNQTYAGFGASVATAGDVNGDGYSDVIVGAPWYDDGQNNEGKVWVYHGSSTGLGATAAWSAQVNQAEAELGKLVATAGDVNGDGYSDVIAGAPYYDVYAAGDNRGMAVVWYGSSGGLEDPGNPSWLGFGGDDDEHYGKSAATAGDVNGDGYADVIVGSPYYSLLFPGGGQARVYHGSATGLSTSSAWDVYGPEDALLGDSVATAGDVNGDGYADVIVGMPCYSNGQDGEGQARVYHGSSTGLSSTAAWSAEINLVVAAFGYSVATAGDVNGDGYSDVIVSAPYYDNGQLDEGKVWVYWGSSGGLSSAAGWTAESDAAGAHFGDSVATAGDVNGDGYSDVIIGASEYTYDQGGEGMAFAFYGGPDNLSQTAGWTYESDYADKNLGQAVATAGDVNGDGYADIIVGAPGYDSGQTDEGAVFVWHGAAGGFGWSGTDWVAYGVQCGAQFGYSVSTAGDVNGDGYSDIIVGAPYFEHSPRVDEGDAFVWLGSNSGLGAQGSPSNADWQAVSDQDSANLGWSVGTAGDVNGDGYADVVAGAPNYDHGNSDEGAVFVWHGGSSGLGANGTPANADWSDESGADNNKLGLSVGAAGDVNRDGYSDLVAGANNFAVAWYGSASGLRASGTDWLVSLSGSFGWSVGTAGDIDGDGYSDVVVGAPFYTSANSNEGGAWAYCGSGSGLAASTCWADVGGKASAWFGWSVGTAGDVNGDGYADIIAGAPGWTNPTTAEGQARVYYGSASRPVSYNGGDWQVEGNSSTANLGYAVSSAGDINGDSYADVLIGAPQYSNGQSSEGQARLYYGNGRMGISPRPRQFRTDGSTPIAPLGRSDSQTSFKVQGTAHSPTGRGKFSLQWEVKSLSTPFDGTGMGGTSWLDTGVSGLTVQETANGLIAGTPYHWRARLRYNPVTNPFNPPRSRWFHVPWNGWNETDLRTVGGGGGGTCASPLPLACGQQVNGDTTGHASSHDFYSCSSWNESGPEVIYRFTLGGSSNYTVTATLSGMAVDLDVFLLASGGCDAGQCLTPGSYGDDTATASNVSAGTYYVAVDGFGGIAGSYTLHLTCTPAGLKYHVYLPLVLRNS